MKESGQIAVAPTTSDERTMAMLAHVLQLVGGWIAPLIIFLVKQDSRFVRFHALQVLLLQGVYILCWIVAIVIGFAVMFRRSLCMRIRRVCRRLLCFCCFHFFGWGLWECGS